MLPQLPTLSLVLFLTLPLCAQKPSPKAKPPQAANPQPSKPLADDHKAYSIAELVATGSERFDADEILKYTGLKVDKNVDVPLEDVKAAAQKLLNSGAFSEVSYQHVAASGGGMRVEFKLADKDDDQFVKTDLGNIIWLPPDELLIEAHDRVPLFNGTVPRDGSLADDVSKALEAILKEHDVSANVVGERPEGELASPADEIITYRAADVSITIAHVDLAGASAEVKSSAEAAAEKLNGQNYNRAVVDKFIHRNLRNFYLQRGYLRVAFGAPAIKVLSGGTQTAIGISIPVAEGKIYRPGAIRWTGNGAVPAKELNTYLHPSPQSAMDGAQLAKDIDKVRVHYATLGYLHASLTPKPSFDDLNGVANYEMQVDEGTRFTMGKLEVEGLQELSTRRVKEAWKMREGDAFDAMYVLNFFGLFEMTKNMNYVVEESEGSHPNSVDVNIIFCRPKDPCKPKNENHFYTPPVADDQEKPQP